MTITLEWRDVLLFVLTAFACITGAYLIVVLRRLRAAVEEVERTARQVREFLPRLEQLTDESTQAVRSIRKLADSSSEAVDDLTAVSSRARGLAEKGLGYLAVILEPLRRLAALAHGIESGLSVFKGLTGRNDESEETD